MRRSMRRLPLAAPVLALALGCTSTRNIPLDDTDRAKPTTATGCA